VIVNRYIIAVKKKLEEIGSDPGCPLPTRKIMSDTFETIPGLQLKRVGEFTTPGFVHRHPLNPILTASMMPYPSSLTFNASVVPYKDRYLMMYRNQAYPTPGVQKDVVSNLAVAESADGIHWTPRPKAIDLTGMPFVRNEAYDPRVVQIEGKYFLTACQHSKHGPHAVTLTTSDFESFELVDVAPPSSRNFTLLPEKIGGKYWRMERPFWQAVDTYSNNFGKWISPPYTIYIASSPDMIHWGNYRLLLETQMFDFANTKIGPGGSPIRTDAGWLLLIHGVDHDPTRGKNGWQASWRNRYHGGVALLDLEDPTRVIAYNPKPFLPPEAPYEISGGFRNNVVFPMTGLVMGDELYVYYGAADTHTCLATCKTADLVAFCLEGVRL
jgi:beta-1,4-mannooligosaccharide/beta-1,4-mannosyl-N-acetylglucosamine phosphorylase